MKKTNKLSNGNKIHDYFTNLGKLMSEKTNFLFKTMFFLIFQIALAFLAMRYVGLRYTINDNVTWVIFAFSLCLIIVLVSVPMNIYLKFFIVVIISLFEGILLSKIDKYYNITLIKMSMMTSVSIFIIMVFFGIFISATGINLDWMMMPLMFGSIGLIGYYVIKIFGENVSINEKIKLNKTMIWFGIYLFSAYVLYDTNIILSRNYNGDFVTASVDYYFDILNIFVNMIVVNSPE